MLLLTMMPASAMVPMPQLTRLNGSPGDQQADQHAAGGEHHGGEHQQRLEQAVELGDQDQRDQPEADQEGLDEEAGGFLLGLCAALEADRDAGVEVERWQRFGDLGQHRIDLYTAVEVGLHEHGPAHVGAHDRRGGEAGITGHETADRHVAGTRRDAQFGQRVDAAAVGGKAHADVDLVVGIVRPVGAELDAVGDQLDDAAHQ